MINAATVASASAGAGHPTWHFALAGAAALGTFGVILLRERMVIARQATAAGHRSRGAVTQERALGRGSVLILGSASAGAAALHAAVGPAHFREAAAFGLFFAIAAAFQGAWAVRVLTRPSESLLLTGAVGNALIVMVWLASRTSGLPLGPEAWRPEAIGPIDALATTLEVAIVAVTAAISLPRRRTAHAALP